MPLRRVSPGTIPRWDPLAEQYQNERFRQNLEPQEMPAHPDADPRAGRFANPRILRKPMERENIEGGRIQKQDISTKSEARFSGAAPTGYWGKDPAWRQLSAYEKAAAMALLEADAKDGRPDFASARNVLGAMINRADKGGEDLGEHVSKKIYQPTIEPAQYRRLQSIVQAPEFQALTRLAEARDTGQVDDWVDGATHFLAHEPVMEGLREKEPNKYKSWVGWTGYDKGGGKYSNPDGSPVMRDRSHAFLAPEGRHTAQRGPLVDVERHHSLPSDIEAPEPSNPANFPIAKRSPANMVDGVDQTPEEARGPSIPHLADVLGVPWLKGGKGRQAKNPLADQLMAQVQGPEAMQLPEQEMGAFQIGQRQQRPMLPGLGRRG